MYKYNHIEKNGKGRLNYFISKLGSLDFYLNIKKSGQCRSLQNLNVYAYLNYSKPICKVGS